MSPELKDRSYLWDMRDASRMIRDFVVATTFHEFEKDRKLQLAVVLLCHKLTFSCGRGIMTPWPNLSRPQLLDSMSM